MKSPNYLVDGSRMWIKTSAAEKIIADSRSKFSCGKDYCYFGESRYQMRGNNTKYLAQFALRKFNGSGNPRGYGYYLAAVSGSYGFGGLQQATKYTFSERVKQQIYSNAKAQIAILVGA